MSLVDGVPGDLVPGDVVCGTRETRHDQQPLAPGCGVGPLDEGLDGGGEGGDVAGGPSQGVGGGPQQPLQGVGGGAKVEGPGLGAKDTCSRAPRLGERDDRLSQSRSYRVPAGVGRGAGSGVGLHVKQELVVHQGGDAHQG